MLARIRHLGIAHRRLAAVCVAIDAHAATDNRAAVRRLRHIIATIDRA